MTSVNGLLVVDDEKDFAAGLARQLVGRFPQEGVRVAHTGPQALELLKNDGVAVMITDLRMPVMDGMGLLKQALEIIPNLSIVMLTAYGDIQTAVKALKNGAYDFLTKPIDSDHLFRVVEKGLERSRLLGENRHLKELVAVSDLQRTIIGESTAILRLRETIAAVSQSDYTVLIRGESGTGKELVARTIHKLSRRSRKPLITVNCPAIPDQLLESELFGHVKGAFTGADHQHQGLFQAAQEGSILLDEIGDISQNIQTKLLRCVQEYEIRPVGSNKNIKVDARILASTNQNLEAKIRDKSFREDLFYRLNVLTVLVPTLADRREDISLLARHFLNGICQEMDIGLKRLTPEALSYLSVREWPGNVRELLNFTRRLAVFAPGEEVDGTAIRLAEGGNGSQDSLAPDSISYKEAKARVVDDFTKSYIQNLLENTKGNVSQAARLSGLERVSLQKILKRLNIAAQTYRP